MSEPNALDHAAALEFWKEFDLDAKKHQLDQQCAEMKDQKAASISGRKKLNEMTKTFRSKSKDDQLEGLTDILKAYQEEIDQLSRRSKLSESAFSGVYKLLCEAPNPAVTIEALMKNVGASSNHHFEIERLKSELAQYEEEFQQLKNQDITIRRLEDQLEEFKEQIEDKVLEEVDRRVVELEQQASGRVSESRDAQRAAERRAVAALESMKQAQAATERAQSQLFDISTQAENRISGLLAENSILAEGSERTNARVVELEGELESVRKMLSTLQARTSVSNLHSSGGSNVDLLAFSNNNSSNGGGGAGAGEDVQTLQAMLTDLRQDIRKKEESSRAEKQRLESSIRDLTAQLAKEREQHSATKRELLERPTKEDVTAVRKQLKFLQNVIFNATEDDDENDNAGDDAPTPMDQLMLTKLKSMENELAESRRLLFESQQSETKNAELIANLHKSVQSSTALIARLERDLELQTSSAGAKQSARRAALKDTDSKERGVLPRPYDSNKGSSLSSTTAETEDYKPLELSELLGVDSDKSSSEKENSEGSKGMVGILQAQRDRYKERLGQVEQALVEKQQQLQAANAAKEQLEADNVALYEKIRYLQTFGSMQKAAAKTGPRLGPTGAILHSVDQNVLDSMRSGIPGLGVRDYSGQDTNGVVGKYHDKYERKMNPFEEFTYQEKQRKLQELSVLDRIILNTVQIVVSTQLGRGILMVYLGMMHFMVFAIIYWNVHHAQQGCNLRTPL